MTSAEVAKSGGRDAQPVGLPELISALTLALDLTEGKVPGHGLRCCVLGMRLAEAAGVPQAQRTALYYALQLKDVGCSGSSGAQAAEVGPRQSSEMRAAAMELRSERARETLTRLEMGDAAVDAVLCLEERWDGSGSPDGLRGEAIPLPARVCAVARSLDVFGLLYGEEAAAGMLGARSGRWFDPELVKAAEALHRAGTLWEQCAAEPVEETRRAVLDLEPVSSGPLSAKRLDAICAAFAGVVDAKSPFTQRHSARVAKIAHGMARVMGLDGLRCSLVRRAGWLHDLGKLGIASAILDKKGPLSRDEWIVMMEHPRVMRSILERVEGFGELAAVAGEHHETLDGAGYPYGLLAEDLSLESRLLAIADRFAGMTERRSYDPGYRPEDALKLLKRKVPHRLDAACFEALQELVRGRDETAAGACKCAEAELATAV